jgi:hypothetical protein
LAALAVLALACLPWAAYAGPLLLGHSKDWIQPVSVGQGLARTLAAFLGGTTLDGMWRALATFAGVALCVAALLIASWRSEIGDRRLAIGGHRPSAIRHRRSAARRLQVPVLALGPALLLGLLSLWRPAFDERFLIGSLPALLTMAAAPIARWWRGPTVAAGAALLLLVALAGRSLANYYFDPAYAKSPDWPGLAAYLAEAARPGDIVLQDFQDPAFGYYYGGPAPFQPAPLDSAPDQTERLAVLLEEHPRIWFFLSDATVSGGDWLDAHAERLADERVHGFRLQVFDSPSGSLAAMTPFEREFAGGVRLVGYRLYPPLDNFLNSGRLHVTLYWQCEAPLAQDYTAFTHFVAADGFRVTGHDSPPGQGRRPTSGWLPGEIVVDPHDLSIPGDLSSGAYMLRVGLYAAATGERLPVVNSPDDSAALPVVVNIPPP